MICFSNPGTIDPRLWSTFGVSVKETTHPIGQFGTGLKYAIAVCLRNRRSIQIVSGGQSYEFASVKSEFRGREFEQVTCNGEPLPFTTELGKHWELWMAYRELASNAMDEGGGVVDRTGADFAADTRVYANLDDIQHSDVFLPSTSADLLITGNHLDVYRGSSRHLYFRGIRAQDLSSPTKLVYNFKQGELTEDRVFKSEMVQQMRIGNLLLATEQSEVLAEGFFNVEGHYEDVINFGYCSTRPPTKTLDLLRRGIRSGRRVNNTLIGAISKYIAQDNPVTRKTKSVEQTRITKAVQFCAKIGYPITYPIHVSVEVSGDVLALAHRPSMSIYLSERILTMGLKQIASTLLEEQFHLQHGLSDYTPQFQQFLIDQIITIGEELTGDVL